MNRFFDGEFMTFGLDVIRHMEADQEDRMDPMIYIFPRMTKCTFYKYGVSGEVSILSIEIPISNLQTIKQKSQNHKYLSIAISALGGTT